MVFCMGVSQLSPVAPHGSGIEMFLLTRVINEW
jgi:hypothetical protein